MIYQQLLEPVINDWSYFDKEPNSSISRAVLTKVNNLDSDLVLAIQGVRRCGKSTLLTQIMSKFNLDRSCCFFINFEDPRLIGNLNTNLLDAILSFASSKVDTESSRYFFFDEIQNIPNWEKWLRLKVDKKSKDYFIITGSNSSLLSGDLSSVLTGRHITLELFPFSFKEFKQLLPEKSLSEYMKIGGFPKAIQLPDPFQLLRQYFIDIIERDAQRYTATKSLAQLGKLVFESTGSELSARRLANIMGTAVDTMLSYLKVLTNAYLIQPCPYFTFSERKRLVRNTKWYPIDCGLMHSIGVETNPNIGKCFESITFHALKNKFREVYYWKEQGEVDFIILEGSKPRPIQVSWDGIKDRHKLALDEFLLKNKNSLDPLIVSKDNFEDIF
jgi:predicted AAA+ superfamily ATPase